MNTGFVLKRIRQIWERYNGAAGWLSLVLMTPMGSLLVMAGYGLGYAFAERWWWSWRAVDELLVVVGVQSGLTLPLLLWLVRGRPRLSAAVVVFGLSAVTVFLMAWLRMAVFAAGGVFLMPALFAVVASALKPVAREHERFRCRRCGYDLFGTRGGHCPECGRMLTVRQRRMFRGLTEAEALGSVSDEAHRG